MFLLTGSDTCFAEIVIWCVKTLRSARRVQKTNHLKRPQRSLCCRSWKALIIQLLSNERFKMHVFVCILYKCAHNYLLLLLSSSSALCVTLNFWSFLFHLSPLWFPQLLVLFFLCHWIFYEAEMLKWKPWTSRYKFSPSAFLAEGNDLAPFFTSQNNSHTFLCLARGRGAHFFLFVFVLIASHRVDVFLSNVLFFFLVVCQNSFVLKSHYVSNWICAEPFRADWLSD